MRFSMAGLIKIFLPFKESKMLKLVLVMNEGIPDGIETLRYFLRWLYSQTIWEQGCLHLVQLELDCR